MPHTLRKWQQNEQDQNSRNHGSRRVQKPKKYGPKPRNHGSTAELGKKSHQNHTKNTLPMSQKHHQTKTPYFGRPASPDGHISAPNLIEVQSRNMSKKISPLRGEFFFCGAREGRHTVGK